MHLLKCALYEKWLTVHYFFLIFVIIFLFVTFFIINLYCFAVRAEWENGGSSGNCLLQTVCRCSLAALLKHTGLQNEACWQDRSAIQM